MAAEPGIEDSRWRGPVTVRTSSNYAVTSGNNWGFVSTSSKPADCTQDVVLRLSSTAPRIDDSTDQKKRRSSSNRPCVLLLGSAVMKNLSVRSAH